MPIKEENKSDIMNLIGYGLAKFDTDFTKAFGCNRKSEFYRYVVSLGLANTVKAVSNRQDSFDPYFDNGRVGWFQRNQRKHIKLYIDSLFGSEDANGFANIVKLYIKEEGLEVGLETNTVSPVTKSKFKQLQETGKEAELYFQNNYKLIDRLQDCLLEDARLWGDGYDFQMQNGSSFILAEVKGVKTNAGSIRMTHAEFLKADEFRSDYLLVVVSNLIKTPKFTVIEDPIRNIALTEQTINYTQTNFHSAYLEW